MPYFKSALRYEFYYSVIAQKRDCNIPNSYYNIRLFIAFEGNNAHILRARKRPKKCAHCCPKML